VDGCLPLSPNTAQQRVVRVRTPSRLECVKLWGTVIRLEHGGASGGVEACAKKRKDDGLQLMRLAGSGYRCHGRPAQVPARCPCSGNEWDEPPARWGSGRLALAALRCDRAGPREDCNTATRLPTVQRLHLQRQRARNSSAPARANRVGASFGSRPFSLHGFFSTALPSQRSHNHLRAPPSYLNSAVTAGATTKVTHNARSLAVCGPFDWYEHKNPMGPSSFQSIISVLPASR
jgi:hypothetical protein